jgi:transposase
MRFETTVFEELAKMSDGEIEIKDVKNKRYIVKKTGDYFEIYSVKKGFIYSFKIQDTASQMYIASGTSRISEKKAFDGSLEMKDEMMDDIEITLRSISLDRYYSYPSYVDRFDENTTVYVIPKKNSTLNGSWKWKRLMGEFVGNTMSYLGHQYQREHSENGWSVDKRRFGWFIPQRRDDRINTSDFCTLLWHNLFRLGAA